MSNQEERDRTAIPGRRRRSDTDSWTKSVIIAIDPNLLPQDGSQTSSDSQTIVLQSPTGSNALSLPSGASPQDDESSHDWERVHEYTRPSISRSSSDGDLPRMPARRGALGSPNGSESGLQLQPRSPHNSGRSSSAPLSPWSPRGPGSLPAVQEEEEGGDVSSNDRRNRLTSIVKSDSRSNDSCSEDDNRCSEDEDGSECSECSEDDETDRDYEQFNAELEELRQKYRSSGLGSKSKSAPPTPSTVNPDSQQWKSASPAGYSSIASMGSSSTQSWLPGTRRGSVPLPPRPRNRQPYADEGGDSSDSNETVVQGGRGRSSRRSSRGKGKEPSLALGIAPQARLGVSSGVDDDSEGITDIEDEVQEGL